MTLGVRFQLRPILSLVLGLLVCVHEARAGSKDPATILGECDAQIEVIKDEAVSEMDALAVEAELELEALYFDQVLPSRLFRAAAGYVAKVEKIESKARAKINKLANKCEAQLTRAGAAPSFFDDLEALVDADLTAISIGYFNSVTSILDSLDDWLFPV
jgi:hypothetical protein